MIKAPRIVAWEITRSCNLACAHCRASAHCEPYPGELTFEECKGVMDDIASFASPILILTGGEPLMRADIWEIIDYARELGLRPVIGTNGTLISDEVAARIAACGIPRVSVSLDFPDAAGQDAFRGKTGAFDEALEGIRNLRAHGVDVQVNTTITKMNSRLVDDMHQLALDVGAVAFHPFLLVPTGRGEDLVDVELTPEEYEEVLTWAYRCQKESPLHFKPTDAPQYYRIIRQQCALEGREVNRETYGVEAMTRGCLGGITFAFISHVGDVQPCGYFDMPLGTVKDEPLSQIWEHSAVFADLRDFDRLKGKCGVCEYKRVCGGCRARALAVSGDYLAEEPYCAYQPRQVVRQRVLDIIQSGFPLVNDPYGALAEELGFSREQVLEAVAALRADGTIRRIGASFSSRSLGYVTMLCALRAPDNEEAADFIAAKVSAHPEVTHNYLRDDVLNVWFTLVCASFSEVDRVIQDIREETGCEVFSFPSTSLFKVNVDFGKGHRVETPVEPSDSKPSGLPFDREDPRDRALVHWMQGDLTGEHPFADVPGCPDEQWVLERLSSWKAEGTIRRFGAFVRHLKMGFAFNGMCVFSVNPDDLGELGAKLAEFPFVSHCYARECCEQWPYNLYAMAHAKSREELEGYVALMRESTGADPRVLVSVKEFKKVSPEYFREEAERSEAR